jgi:TonB-linked SusC/RagA family outer membrane protein
MMRKIWFLLMLIILSSFVSNAQIKITGKVIDSENGEGLPGANVIVQGSTIGTTTNIDGIYTLVVTSTDDILEFSYIGYLKKQIKVGNQTTINVKLISDSQSLDEVIVTAIGIKAEKKSLGYAAQEVKGDDLNTVSQTNIVNSLSSKVAGVEIISSSGTPGASSNIVIRGRTSLQRSNSPLFVIDGVPMSNDYSGSDYVDHSNRAIDINSNDVESITVLKGGAATALYGIRAANGAIIITTKSGKGRGDKRQQITFKTSLGFDQVNKLPEKQYKYAQGTNGEYISTDRNSWGPLIDTLRYDGLENPFDLNGNIVGMNDSLATDQRVIPYDNVNDFFQTAIKSDSYLSLSGGNDMGNFYMSLGHLDQTGVVPNSEFKRTTVKLSGDMEISEKLKFSGNASYSNSDGVYMQKGSNLSAVMVGLMRVSPTFDITNGSSDPVNDESAYMFPDGSQRTVVGRYDNPYWTINKNKAFSTVNRLIGNTQVNYELFPWLNAVYRIGIDYYNDRRQNYLDNYSTDKDNGYIRNSNYEYKTINSDLLLTFEKNLTEKLKLTVIGGHNYYIKNTYSIYHTGEIFTLPDYYNIRNTETQLTSDYTLKYKLVGGFYDIKLAYNNYLYFNTTGRKDWSSSLPPDDNSFFYPSVNLGFIFTEAFKISENLSFFDYGKVRVSWAKVGYDAGPYSLEQYFVGRTGGTQGQMTYATSRTIGSMIIVPEETYSYEGGIDLRFFKNRIGLDLAYYNSKSDGQIIRGDIAVSAGFAEMVMNSGTVTNSGIEAQLYLTPVKAKDFIWDMTVNFAKNKNVVEDLPEGLAYVEFENTGVSSTKSLGFEGAAFGSFYGGIYERNENGDILVGDDGYPLTTDGVIGDPNPDFTLGIRNTFTYKGIVLTAVVDIKKGGDVYNGTKAVMNSLGTSKETENRDEDFIFDGVNVNTGLPNDVVIKKNSIYYSRQGPMAGLTEAYLEDGSFVRLRELALMYNLPSKWIEKLPVSSLSVGLSGRNLLLFTNYSGIDPETNLSGAANSLGRDYFNMPNTRSYELNLQITL